MSQFDIRRVDYEKISRVDFPKPSEIGFYSIDGERNFHNDNHQMKWIYKPPSGWDAKLSPDLFLDLNVGFAQGRLDFQETKMEHIMRWILENQAKIPLVFKSPQSNDGKIDFVCARGLLTKICATVFDKNGKWSFCASKFQSVIYMCSFETETENETKQSRRMTFWGAKFEHYMTSATPNSPPNTSMPVNKNEGFYIVLKGHINGYNLLYTAEVDGKDPAIPEKSPDCYVELKTEKNGADKNWYHRQKLLKWRMQSFLVGIPKIICGIRDDNGVVKQLRTYTVESVNDKEIRERSLKFCHQILQFVERCVTDDSGTVYRFTFAYQPFPIVNCETLTNPGEYEILPEWFTTRARLNH